MDWSLAPWDLTWDEVDPDSHPFEADSALQAVQDLPPADAVPVRPPSPGGDPALIDEDIIDWAHDAGDTWADAMTRAMIERWGSWVIGWRWSSDAGFGGGPVRKWCCAVDSITVVEETLARVSAALTEWRAWLEELAAIFEQYPLASPATSEDWVRRERAGVNLIQHVASRTEGGDAWYRHCAQVLTWYLTRWGTTGYEAQRLVDEAIGGRFLSWLEPTGEVVHEVAGRLGRADGDPDTGHADG